MIATSFVHMLHYHRDIGTAKVSSHWNNFEKSFQVNGNDTVQWTIWHPTGVPYQV